MAGTLKAKAITSTKPISIIFFIVSPCHLHAWHFLCWIADSESLAGARLQTPELLLFNHGGMFGQPRISTLGYVSKPAGFLVYLDFLDQRAILGYDRRLEEVTFVGDLPQFQVGVVCVAHVVVEHLFCLLL